MSSLEGYGEDRLVRELTRGLPLVGDDCAVIPGVLQKDLLLLKTDAVVEGIHFLRTASPAQIGWKAICRAISDIGAMGGKPMHALVTLGLPADLEVTFVRALFAGIRKAGRKFGVEIAGGETSRSPGPLFVSISLTGSVAAKNLLTRSGAKPGDLLYVTGRLGGSIGGRHLTFTPRLAEGQFLAASGGVTAMMDLSDGIGADLPRLLHASGAGAELWDEKLPCHPGVTPEAALSDGEDYELLFTLRPGKAANLEAAWKRQFPKLPLTQIGVITARRAGKWKAHGYDHFG